LSNAGRGRVIEFVIIAVLGVAVVWLGWDRLQREETVALASSATAESAQSMDSIAVLPFVNLSGDPENEYFGDGLAEELLNVLVKIDGLRVTARTSSFQYRGQNQDIRKIGAALGVATILEGSVRKFGQRVRVTAQLIRADDGFHLWSETFDRDLADIFAVQDEISIAIADALRGTFSNGDSTDAALKQHRQTTNVAAFEAYLRGRFAMNKRTPESLSQAITDFRQAISLDANYAAAFSGLSDSYLLQASYADLDLDEALRLAEPMMQQAISLDPSLAEAQASRGFVLGEKGDSEGAISAFKHSIELNPSYSPAHHWLALRYQKATRLFEAKQALIACLEVDPGYATGKRVLLGLLRSTGEDQQADELANSMAAAHSDDGLVQQALSEDALDKNRVVAAVNFAAAAVRLQPDSANIRFTLAWALGAAGDLDRADAQIARLPADNPMRLVWPLLRARFAGDFEQMERVRVELAAQPPLTHTWYHQNCLFAADAGIVESIIDACGGILERAQWQPGQPLPPELNENVGPLLAAYQKQGNQERFAELRSAIDTELATLEANGMSGRKIEFYRASMALFHGDKEPVLAKLPEWVDTNPISAASLRHNYTWQDIRDDPRFQALIEQIEAKQVRVLAAVKALPVP